MVETVFDKNETFCILNTIPDMSLDNFSDRMRFQKIGYLAQKMGADGQFMFSWYIHGPYSGSLTKMLYRADYLDILDGKRAPTPREKRIIGKIKYLMGVNNLDDMRLLELYASVWYLLPGDIVTDADEKRVIETMKAEKPHFEENEIYKCINNIKNYVENVSRNSTNT